MTDSTSKDLIIKDISNSPLVKKEYKQMLTNIRSTLPAIKKTSSNFYKSHSQFMGVMLDVTPNALSEIVDIAIKRKTGARALRSVMEKVMLDIMYELPSLEEIKACKITRDVILNNTKPVYIKLKKTA